MGQIRKPLPVKLIMSIFAQKDTLFNTIEKTLVRKFGAIDFSSQILNFNQTQYYKNEFGDNLKREIVSFRKLIPPDNLWKIKIMANTMEDKFLKGKKRQINIDPGYITQANLILATTKDYSHRIYIKKGIFEEITLIFRNKTFTALPWTYPDYQSKELTDIFIQIRNILIMQLKK